jgi:hypothetical protein
MNVLVSSVFHLYVSFVKPDIRIWFKIISIWNVGRVGQFEEQKFKGNFSLQTGFQ